MLQNQRYESFNAWDKKSSKDEGITGAEKIAHIFIFVIFHFVFSLLQVL